MDTNDCWGGNPDETSDFNGGLYGFRCAPEMRLIVFEGSLSDCSE